MCKIVIIFLLIGLNINYVLGTQRNCLTETFLLSAHNILDCFG